jgi:gliding motility-associated-like protein
MDKYMTITRNFVALLLLLSFGHGISSAQNELHLFIDSLTAECGDTIVVPVRVNDFNQVVALDFSLTWNDADLEFTGERTNLNAAMGVTLFNFGPYAMPDNDTLTFQWFNAFGVSIPDSSVLFALTFIVRGGAGIQPIIRFGNEYTPIVCGKIIGGSITEVNVITQNGVVDIIDEELPQITCPMDTMVLVDAGNAGAVLGDLDANASDNCAVDTLMYTLDGATVGTGLGTVSGTFFNIGTTSVTYRAVDFAGNEVDCVFSVTVNDTLLRLFVIAEETVPCDEASFIVDITAENFNTIASLQFGLSWDPAVLAFQNLLNFNPSLNLGPANFGPAMGIADSLRFSWFNPGGVTLADQEVLFSIEFSVVGQAGTLSSIRFGPAPALPIEASKAQAPPAFPIVVGVETFNASILIFDNIAPTVTCPDDVTIQVPQLQSSAVVDNIDPIAADNCAIDFVEYILAGATSSSGLGSASGQTFNLGVTSVQYLVADFGGNVAECTFVVTLQQDSLVIIVDIPDVLCTDSLVQVCITATGFNNLASLQFAVQWDGAVLAYDSISFTNPSLALQPSNFGPSGGINDTLTFSWFNPFGTSVPDSEALFCIAFSIPGGINSISPISIVNFPSLPIQASVAQPAPQIPIVIPVFVANDTLSLVDDEPPVIENCPPSVTIENDPGQCAAVHTWADLVATDNCDPDPTISCTASSGGSFEVGTTLIQCIAFDLAGLSDTCSFTVTVLDTESPVLVCNFTDIFVASEPDTCGVFVEWDLPTATDNCDPDIVINGPAASGFYAPGGYTITYTAIDPAGNISSCSFGLFVLDVTPPVFTDCPEDITVDGTNPDCSATLVPPIPSVEDNCAIADLSFKIDTDDPPFFYFAGQEVTLPQGTSVITWYAFDNFANLDSCSYSITVDGGGAFTLFCPDDITVQADEENCSVAVFWDTPGFEGGCGPADDLVLVGTHTPGSLFGAGETLVTYYLLDSLSSDTLAFCDFTITVFDVTPPFFIDCPGTLFIAAAPDDCGALGSWDVPLAVDNCTDPVPVTLISGPTPGFFLPNGVYNVTYRATDEAGNTALCDIIITICDTIAPVIANCPSDTVIMLPPDVDSCTVFVTWDDPEFSDNCTSTEDLIIVQNILPGEFGTGPRTIIYTVTDGCANVSTCSFNVSVLEGFPPTANCPRDVTISPSGNIVADPDNFIDSFFVNDCKDIQIFFRTPDGTDNCSGTTTIQIDQTGLRSGDIFQSGNTYTLIFLIADASGNTDTCNVNITIAPYQVVVSASPNPACIDEDVQLFAETFPGAQYNWSGPAGYTANQQNPFVPVFMASNAGTYSVTVTQDTCPNPLLGSVAVGLLPFPVAVDDNFEILSGESIVNGQLLNNDTVDLINFNVGITFLTQPATGTLINNMDGTFTYESAPGFVGVVSFIYEICYQECPEYCSSAVVVINIRPVNESCKPNNLITPNNDDRNDVLIIDCIKGTPSKFPFNSLKIYNQWGDQVFAASPYQNNWDGTFQGDSGKPLPDGTYYYVFLRGDNSEPITGFITVLR